jgi:hypothetical protein
MNGSPSKLEASFPSSALVTGGIWLGFGALLMLAVQWGGQIDRARASLDDAPNFEPDVTFESLLPKPGFYRIWTQFLRAGRDESAPERAASDEDRGDDKGRIPDSKLRQGARSNCTNTEFRSGI